MSGIMIFITLDGYSCISQLCLVTYYSSSQAFFIDQLRENRPFAKIIINVLEAHKVTVAKKTGYSTSKNFVLEMESPILSIVTKFETL